MTNYFSHDSNARNSEKLIRVRMRHGAAGYGVYFMILERLREATDYMSVKDYNLIAFDLRVDAALIKSVIEDFGLFSFTESGECFYSEGFSERMGKMDKVSEARSAAGKAGMSKRWGKKPESSDTEICVSDSDNKSITNVIPDDSKGIAKVTLSDNNKTNKIKLNKSYSSSRSRTREEGEQEEQERFFYVFFFRNFKDPRKEVERFVSWNEVHGWATKDGQHLGLLQQRIGAATLWKPEKPDDIGRCPAGFLDKLWCPLYGLAQEASPDIARLMLDTRCTAEKTADGVRLVMPQAVAKWIEGNLDRTAPVVKSWCGKARISYKFF